MTRTWNLSEEIYRSLHQWPQLVLFFLIGCLLGGVVSWILPPTYRATASIHVGIHPYRAYEDSRFIAQARPKYSNIDDYKNWQMNQLKSAIFLDEIIEETLELLRQEDNYWESVDIDQLREMLHAEWRTAGRWNLIAEHSDAERASQAALAWRQAAVARLSQAIWAAQSAFMTDEELLTIIQEYAQANSRQDILLGNLDGLQEWSQTLQELPQDQPLDTTQRWQVLYLAGFLADFSPVWQDLLLDQPAPEALPMDYQDWISRITAYVNEDIRLLEVTIKTTSSEKGRLEALYREEARESLGLSSNLDVESLDEQLPEPVRPTEVLLLVGGFLGLCTWVVLQFAIITRRVRKNEQAEFDQTAG